MAWWGKLVGGAFGFMLGGPLGALLGVSFGHRFDARDAPESAGLRAGDQERVQAAFFTATFAVMGHIAKADGRVSRDEIALAERVMSHMRLDRAQRRLAMSLFDQGKSAGFEIDEVLSQFRRECHRRSDLIGMFMEIQIEAALADGHIAPQEREILQRVAQQLGVAREQLAQLINLILGAHGDARADGGAESLANAYRILGVSADTPLAEVRTAYRRLLRRHHPDKLVSKGLPEEMIKLANEKTHEIRSAWERIKAARK
ncbi:MAG: co-chaperone DjlA [bacterium]